MIIPDYPSDEVLRNIGRLSVRHGQLDYALKMLIKDLAGITQKEALAATMRMMSRDLREWASKLAAQRLGRGPTLLKITGLLNRARKLADTRNEHLHALWAGTLDGDRFQYIDNEPRPEPTSLEIEKVADDMAHLAFEFHEVRLNGWLREALTLSSSQKQTQTDVPAESQS